jgi:nitroreductase
MRPNPDWYPAINIRRSRRQYDRSRIIEAEKVNRLLEVCSSFHPYSSARVEFIPEPPDDIFRNAVGFYSNIQGAQSFLAFIGDTSDPDMQEKIGYTGEAAILEATALGLGTCWVALTYNSRAAHSILKIAKNEKLVCVSPVGYPSDKITIIERAYTGFGANHQRRPLAGMVTGLGESERPAWAQAAVEAARLAPSAVNRQPWNFHVEKNSITVSVLSPGMELNVSKRLDCGIAMLHFEMGALSKGIKGRWEILKQPKVARFTVE